jgi:hypothetical protein
MGPLFAALLLCCSIVCIADTGALTGTWAIDEDSSETLQDEIDTLKQEYRDHQTEQGTISDPDQPDPFQSRRELGEKEWAIRSGGQVAKPSLSVRTMLRAESIKLYVSERIVVAYDGEIKRLLNPNPIGRVHSATGKGVSKDVFGQTLAYLDADAVVVETRTYSAERLVERFEIDQHERLKLTTDLHNPTWRRDIKFVRYYTRAEHESDS